METMINKTRKRKNSGAGNGTRNPAMATNQAVAPLKSVPPPQPASATAPTKSVQTAPAPAKPVPTPVPVAQPVAPSVKAEPRAGNQVSLEFRAPQASQVSVAGSFNGWKPEKTPLVRTGDGNWVGKVAVSPGRYEYLFVVDGQWVPDPKAKENVQNPFGGQNSVLVC
jgi:hypothetical protein